jgi:TonB family protein
MRLVLIALWLTASTAHAESWLQVADLDKNGGLLLLDMASIDRGNDVRTATFKSVFTSDHPIADGYRDVPPNVKSYRWESNQGHFNCTTQGVAVSQSILHGADGQVVGRIDLDSSALKFREAAPGSFGGILLKAVCASSAAEAAVAKLKSIVNPDNYYPAGSKRRGEEGSPVVKVCVGPSGKLLGEPEITDTSGFPDLDAAAVKAAKDMRYAPAIQDGAATAESCLKYKIKFTKWPN